MPDKLVVLKLSGGLWGGWKSFHNQSLLRLGVLRIVSSAVRCQGPTACSLLLLRDLPGPEPDRSGAQLLGSRAAFSGIRRRSSRLPGTKQRLGRGAVCCAEVYLFAERALRWCHAAAGDAVSAGARGICGVQSHRESLNLGLVPRQLICIDLEICFGGNRMSVYLDRSYVGVARS